MSSTVRRGKSHHQLNQLKTSRAWRKRSRTLVLRSLRNRKPPRLWWEPFPSLWTHPLEFVHIKPSQGRWDWQRDGHWGEQTNKQTEKQNKKKTPKMPLRVFRWMTCWRTDETETQLCSWSQPKPVNQHLDINSVWHLTLHQYINNTKQKVLIERWTFSLGFDVLWPTVTVHAINAQLPNSEVSLRKSQGRRPNWMWP